jgi:hypothetical protein
MLVKEVLGNGGTLRPLVISSQLTGGTGLCNPSVLVDQGRVLVNIRHVEYNLYHSTFGQKFPSRWGPLSYLHPEDVSTLRTVNYLGELDENLELKWYTAIDTSKLDVTPIWTFTGLEDGRLVKWEDKIYLIGVRRDTTDTGEGRIEYSELQIEGTEVTEITRTRIEPPNWSYCEKNWMPVSDRPHEFVKWCSPTEVVKADLENKSSTQVALKEHTFAHPRDLRGSSQVISVGENYLAITHEADLWHNEAGQNNARYYHRAIMWDKEWNVIKLGKEFNFMDGHIEFCTGIAELDEDFIITFGYQDNAAYVLKGNKQTILNYLF